MKRLLMLAIILGSLYTTAQAAPKYYFANGDQQVELQNSVYKLAQDLQTAKCKINVLVSSEYQDSTLFVLDRHVSAEVTISAKGKWKRITNSYLDFSNWMKFEYNVRQLVLEVC